MSTATRLDRHDLPNVSSLNISFSFPHKRAFVIFSHLEGPEAFPKEFTDKFTMGRVLGTGASGVVRLAYGFQDLHRVAAHQPNHLLQGTSSDQILSQ